MKARPESVICQPDPSRSTNREPKISNSGARAFKRFMRAVQSDPLVVRMARYRLRSTRLARPSGWAFNIFKIAIWKLTTRPETQIFSHGNVSKVNRVSALPSIVPDVFSSDVPKTRQAFASRFNSQLAHQS